MDPKSHDHMDRQEVKDALADMSDAELRQVGARVEKSHAEFEQSLRDLQNEQAELKEENKQLHNTIELMMASLRKLNIGADNVIEPELEETPAVFVGRMWEMLRPRDTAVPVSEHIGEIALPTSGTDGGITARLAPLAEGIEQISTSFEDAKGGAMTELKYVAERSEELKKQVAERGLEIHKHVEERRLELAAASQELGKQVAERTEEIGKQATELGQDLAEQGQILKKHVAERLSFLYGDSQEAEDAEGAVDDSAEVPKASGGEHLQELRTKVMGRFSDAMSFFKQESDESTSPNTVFSVFSSGWQSILEPSKQTSKNGYMQEAEEKEKEMEDEEGSFLPSSVAAVLRPGLAVNATSSTSTNVGSGSDFGAATPEGDEPVAKSAPEDPSVAPGAEPALAQVAEPKEARKDLSTLMIRASLHLGEGSEPMIAEVRAADRPKEVAATFIRDHSLKAWYEAPLIAFLKDTEAGADSFPVHVEADLNEIRKQYSSSKA